MISPGFLLVLYYLQAIDLIETKIYIPLHPTPTKKPPENACGIYFENKGTEFINIARIFKSPPTSSVKFSMPIVTYKLTPPISTKFFNFKNFSAI